MGTFLFPYCVLANAPFMLFSPAISLMLSLQVFPGGRLEEFIPGHPLTTVEMRSPQFSEQIARYVSVWFLSGTDCQVQTVRYRLSGTDCQV